MPLGTEVDLGPCHIMLDGDPAPPPPTSKGLVQQQNSINVKYYMFVAFMQ